MFNWRITKYNPNYRDELGRYQKNEWTSFSEIGKTFNRIQLTTDDYIAIENVYVDAKDNIMFVHFGYDYYMYIGSIKFVRMLLIM